MLQISFNISYILCFMHILCSPFLPSRPHRPHSFFLYLPPSPLLSSACQLYAWIVPDKSNRHGLDYSYAHTDFFRGGSSVVQNVLQPELNTNTGLSYIRHYWLSPAPRRFHSMLKSRRYSTTMRECVHKFGSAPKVLHHLNSITITSSFFFFLSQHSPSKWKQNQIIQAFIFHSFAYNTANSPSFNLCLPLNASSPHPCHPF